MQLLTLATEYVERPRKKRLVKAVPARWIFDAIHSGNVTDLYLVPPQILLSDLQALKSPREGNLMYVWTTDGELWCSEKDVDAYTLVINEDEEVECWPTRQFNEEFMVKDNEELQEGLRGP